MAQIRVENLHKAFDEFTAVHDSNFTIEDGDLLCLARTIRLRQDDDAAHDRRARAADLGRILLDGEDVTFRRAAARDIAFVFQLFALYPHMNVRAEHRLPAQMPGHGPRARSASGSRRRRGSCASSICSIEQVVGLVRRRPPARRAWPRHRAAAEGVPDGRAARRARCRVPPSHVRRAARPARPHRRDHGLRHARPARGDVDGRPHRRHERAARSSRSARRRRSTTGRPACSSPTSSARRR